MNFYTNVQVLSNKILFRGIEGGFRSQHKVDYKPKLFVPSKKPTDFTTIYGEYVSEIKFGTIRDCRDFCKKYEDVENFKIYGMQRYEYAFISDTYPSQIDWDISRIRICTIDIEVGSENGFPEPETASEPITAITYKMGDDFVVFGCGSFHVKRKGVHYVQCLNEMDLLAQFLGYFGDNHPDIITGWNVKFFDIPYLINRMRILLGEDTTKGLSPWKFISERKAFVNGREQISYSLVGIAVLDYLELYKKFAPGGNSQESYKLDNICHVELGERKLSYEEYGNLHTLYRDNYQLFIEYNIRDVELVEKLDDKLKLIELALTLAYDSKTNYEDVFTQVRMWDILIYNHLKNDNVVIPPSEKNRKDAAYIGAYVKDPIVGMHEWVASFDLNSLYPHLIMQYNISPETLLEPEDYEDVHKSIISAGVSVDSLLRRGVDTSGLTNHTVTPNGQFFRTDHQGFLPEMMEAMYDDRSKYKKKALAAKKELEQETDPHKRFEIEKRIARYNNLQLAKKVSLNSAYGALGNEYFRFFDVRQASAITTAGQLSIRWIENHLNEYMNKILNTEDKDYVIASDTDSIYLHLGLLVSRTIAESSPNASPAEVIKFLDKVCENKIQPFIDGAFGRLAVYTHAYKQKMIMKREALADRGIWTAKKRYILRVYNNEGVQYAKPKIKVMGLEMIKSSTPSACREKLWEVVDVVFEGNEDAVIDFIDNFRNEFRKYAPAEIAFPRGVNGLEKFSGKTTLVAKGCPIHVRGSLVYNDLIEKHKLEKKYEMIKDGEKIKFLYMKEPNVFHSNIISFHQVLPKELDIDKYIDYDMQFNKSFVEPLKIILDCIGWKTQRVSSLEGFFS